jgi:hypothetical protein
VANPFAVEAALLRALRRFATRVPHPPGHAYGSGSPLVAFACLAPFLLLGEGLALDQFIHGAAWRIVHWSLSAYAVLYLFGIVASVRERPHRIADGTLTVACGALASAKLPLSAIEEVTVIADDAEVPPEERLFLPGTSRVRLRLKTPQRISRLFGRPRQVHGIVVSADDPTSFCKAIDLARASA